MYNASLINKKLKLKKSSPPPSLYKKRRLCKAPPPRSLYKKDAYVSTLLHKLIINIVVLLSFFSSTYM